MVDTQSKNDTAAMTVRVVPGSNRTEFVGMHEGQYKIKIAAPPEKGKANKALVNFLARQLHIKKNDVQIRSGQTSRVKQVLLRGVSNQHVQTHFSNPR